MLSFLPSSQIAPLKVLCLGAHADDLEIGAGGTLLRLFEDRAVDLCWVVASAAGSRAEEARASVAGLARGAASCEVHVWDLTENLFPSQLGDLKSRLWELQQTFAPDLVFSHRLEDRHQDHRTCAEVIWQTFRDQAVLEFEIAKFEGDLGQPNLFVPLDVAQMDRKLQHLEAHFPSQAGRPWFDPEAFRALARLRGVECNAASGYAEAFTARKLTLDFS